MFHWEPEGHNHCDTKSMPLAPLWFSTEHLLNGTSPPSGLIVARPSGSQVMICQYHCHNTVLRDCKLSLLYKKATSNRATIVLNDNGSAWKYDGAHYLWQNIRGPQDFEFVVISQKLAFYGKKFTKITVHIALPKHARGNISFFLFSFFTINQKYTVALIFFMPHDLRGKKEKPINISLTITDTKTTAGRWQF